MEISSANWIFEVGVEDPIFMNEYDMNSLDYSVLDDLNFESLSADSYSSYPDLNPKSVHMSFNSSAMENPHTGLHRPAEQLKTSSWISCTTGRMTSMATSSSSQLISFEKSDSAPTTSQKFLDCTVKPKKEAGSDLRNMNFPTLISESSFEIQNFYSKHEQVRKRVGTMTRTPLDAKDHVMAERKRREKLSQRLIALSAIVPGLKKMDKASVLGEAIKYLEQLQERVKILEEQAAMKTTKSVVFVQKTRLSADDDISSSDENSDCHSEHPLPEIEARVAGKNVLIRIHCDKSKGCAAKILSETEKLDLTIISSNFLPFGNSTLIVTVAAQMDEDFCITAKDLARNLRRALAWDDDE